MDEEERELSQFLESGSGLPKSVLTSQRKRELKAMARATINGDRAKISLRVPKNDLIRLKSRAMQEGVPVQTLINSLIHKYVAR